MGQLTPLAHALQLYFADRGWAHEADADGTVFRLAYESPDAGAKWECLAYALEGERQVVFFSVAPLDVPAEDRPAAAEYLTRANFGMVLGAFEMDMDDGHVRFRTSLEVGDTELTPALIEPLVGANVAMMTRYLPGLVSVVFEDQSPQEAVSAAED